MTPEQSPASVCAVVVTYNRVSLLQRTLEAVTAQSRPVDHVLVVDNASSDATADLLATQWPEVDVIRLERNTGGAGGFHTGMKAAYGQGFAWLWIMDDDVAPAPDCLDVLLHVSDRKVRVPRRIEPDGTDAEVPVVLDVQRQIGIRRPVNEEALFEAVDLFTFEGPLIHRQVVADVGLPEPGHFIAGDDTIYAARIFNHFGPGASAHIPTARLHRQLATPPRNAIHLAPKRWLTQRSSLVALPDDASHWKWAYSCRNRHLLYDELGWTRRRLEHVLLHAGYVVVDAALAATKGWRWRRRLRWNLRSFWSGVRLNKAPFLDPGVYAAE